MGRKSQKRRMAHRHVGRTDIGSGNNGICHLYSLVVGSMICVAWVCQFSCVDQRHGFLQQQKLRLGFHLKGFGDLEQLSQKPGDGDFVLRLIQDRLGDGPGAPGAVSAARTSSMPIAGQAWLLVTRIPPFVARSDLKIGFVSGRD